MGESAHPRQALLRFSGEIGIKGRGTRLQFRKRLLRNLRDALHSEEGSPRIDVSHTRVLVELPEHFPGIDVPEALADHPLTRVFGVQSVSLVERHPVVELDEIVRRGVALFRDAVRGKRFAVRARRVGDRSQVRAERREVERRLGEALRPESAGVDLEHPQVTARIELGEEATCFFSERTPAPGGLPLGVEGSALALLSGGFDSAVAAWLMQKRGVRLDYVFCNLGGRSHLQGVLSVAKVLADRWSYGERPRLHEIHFEPLAAALQARTEKRYWQVLLKRLMLRAAARVLREGRAAALVTGDAVGQVSSQTLQNLAVVSRAVPETVLRPLLGFNKEEIIELARRIGTFDLSKVVGEYCALVPSRPATAARLAVVEAEEQALDPVLLERAVATRSIHDLRALDVSDFASPDLDVDRIPPGATVIDLRPVAQYRSGHYPEALHLEFGQAVEVLDSLDRERTYVLSCEFGLLSAHLAELMRRRGFRAYHFRGGQRALMRSAPRPERSSSPA